MNREEMQKQLLEGGYDLRYVGIDFQEINTKIDILLELLGTACNESEDLASDYRNTLEAIEEGIEEFEYPDEVIEALKKGVEMEKRFAELTQKLYDVYDYLEEV